MSRLLVVVDGTAEAALALDRAMDMAGSMPESELILLGVAPTPPPWEARRKGRLHTFVQEILARAGSSAAARGISVRTRLEQGETAEVVIRVARQETCDQIFVAEAPATLTTRAFVAIAAACTGRAAGRIISNAGVPVTVVAPKGPR